MAEEEKDQTRRLRRNVRLAVDNGHGWKGLVGLQPSPRSCCASFAVSSSTTDPLTAGRSDAARSGRHKHGEQTARETVLHLTPLCNKEGKVEALVAVCVTLFPSAFPAGRLLNLSRGRQVRLSSKSVGRGNA